jgi:cephalosporin hydroxylase
MSINVEALDRMQADTQLRQDARDLFIRMCRYRYSYNFTWLGRPIIQFPDDIIALQEIVWRIKPDLIIETGIAHGGSLMLWASLLQMLGGDGHVVGIDVDIRANNRSEIERHPLSSRITMIEGSSVDSRLADRVRILAAGRSPVMVVLDSNHTHEHVLHELELYSMLVTPGSYLVVMDTVVEAMPSDFYPDRPWGKGNNPATAVAQFLQTHSEFAVDWEVDRKLLMSVAPGGYLQRRGNAS